MNEETIKEEMMKVEALTAYLLSNTRRGMKKQHDKYLTAVGYIEMLQDALIALKISIKKELK